MGAMADVFFAAEPPSFSETTMMIVVLSALMGFNAWLCSKFKLGQGAYWIIGFFIVAPTIGAAWMGFHSIVYGASEVSLFATFLFGWLGATITIALGTWIFWYVWHFWNNIFARLRDVVEVNEDVVFLSIIALVMLLIFWISIELIKKKLGNKNKYVPPVIQGG